LDERRGRERLTCPLPQAVLTLMAEEIRQAESLTDEQKQRLFGWGDNIFGVASYKLSWRPKDLHFLLYLDGEPVSHVGVLKHVISLNGEPATVGGVGGVVTLPEAQKKGFARRLMRHTAKFFEREWKVDGGLLFCLPGLKSYYEALGWQEVESAVVVAQPNGKIASPLPVMVLPLSEGGWSSGSIDLRSLPW
jgi:GNAT superfamily N-acetyltransferase